MRLLLRDLISNSRALARAFISEVLRTPGAETHPLAQFERLAAESGVRIGHREGPKRAAERCR